MKRRIKTVNGSSGVVGSQMVYPSDLFCLDYGLLGVGGFPNRRITQIAGAFSAGKSSLCYLVMKNCIDAGGRVVFVDAEKNMDELSGVYFKSLGLSLLDVDVVSADYIEQAFVRMEEKVKEIRKKSQDCPLVVVYDSVVGLPTRVEFEASYEDTLQRGLLASVFSRVLRKWSSFVYDNNVCSIFTNQLRDNPEGGHYSDPEYIPGGRAFGFYSSLILKMRAVKDDNIGREARQDRMKVRLRLEKTKVASIPLKTSFDLYFVLGKGFDKVLDLVNFGIDLKLIKQMGSWFEVRELEVKVQGVENLVSCFREDSQFLLLKSLVKEKLKSNIY